MKKYIVCILCLVFPSFILRQVLKLFKIKMGSKSKIGFSIILTSDIKIEDSCRIGHLNFIKVDKLRMQSKSYINHLNIIKGPVGIILKKRGAIGKNNYINRGPKGITYGESNLTIGELGKITAYHFIDLTRSITVGDFSTLAGIRSQLWTHGYVHAESGPDRFRVDGEIHIGNNVYVGSGVLINPGVKINDTINIGGNATISKSLIKKGMYVNQGLRYLEKDYHSIKDGLSKVTDYEIVENVYEKNL